MAQLMFSCAVVAVDLSVISSEVNRLCCQVIIGANLIFIQTVLLLD